MKRMAVVGMMMAAFAAVALFGGCPPATPGTNSTNPSGGGGGKAPVFTLAWSEYPSWSVFGVASEKGLIDGEKGKLGRLEEKWGVDIELQLLSYEKCMSSFSSKQSDAACLTNMDTLNPALDRKTVAIMPTSTSAGADALIVVGVADLDDLLKHKVHGLSESVSDYAFYRLLEQNGKDPKKYEENWKNLDPSQAQKEMANKAPDVKAIMVWNPMKLQTLRDRSDSRVMFDSSKIPEEIIDMVVVGDDVLSRDKGKEFACCVVQAFYEFNILLDTTDKEKRKNLLIDLGKKFSSLGPEDMDICCKETKFYNTPEKALELIDGLRTDTFKKRMDSIVRGYVDRKILKNAPVLGYGARDKAENAKANLIFDPTYIKLVKEKLQ